MFFSFSTPKYTSQYNLQTDSHTKPRINQTLRIAVGATVKTAILSLFVMPVMATETLDQMIVSANRVVQSKNDYTGNITVITGESLVEKSIQTLPEALDRLAGIPMYSNGGLGSTSTVFVRGHDSKRILLLVDGMRFNDPSGTSGAQWQHLLVGDIERIEIIEGAQAGIWGSDAAAGVINVITKTAPTGTHGSMSYALGTLGQKQTQGSVSYADQAFDARLSYTGLSSDEFSSITPIVNGIKQNPLSSEKDGYRNDTLSTKLGYNFTKTQRLEINAFRSDAKGFFDGFSANDITPYASFNQQTLGASYHFELLDWKLTFNAQTGSLDRNFVMSDVSPFNASVEQQSIVAYQKDSLGSWTLGIDHLQQSSQAMSSSGVSGHYQQQAGYIARTQTFQLPTIEQPTIVNISVRHDDFSDFNSYTGKRLGIKQLLTKDAYLSINMADSRRTPSLFERFVQYNNYPLPATTRTDYSSLRPETVNSKEISIGWKGYSLTHFEDSVSNLIDYDFISNSYNNLSGTAHLQGWEWKVIETLPYISSEISLSYIVLDAKNQNGLPLARRPENSGNASITYLGMSDVVLGLQAQHTGNRIDSYNSVTGAEGPNTGNYWLWHANASYQWDKQLRIFAKAINLTDERIAQGTNSYQASTPTSYYAYSPRTFWTGIEYRF